MRGGMTPIPSRLIPNQNSTTSWFMCPCQMYHRKDPPSLALQLVFPAQRIEIDHGPEVNMNLMFALG